MNELLVKANEIINFKSPTLNKKLKAIKKLAEKENMCGYVALTVHFASKDNGKYDFNKGLIQIGGC